MAHDAAIGKYRIERVLGRGATSTVYLGYDPFHRQAVAVKQLHRHLLAEPAQAAQRRQRLRQEALRVRQLQHPHIVRLYDADDQAAAPYLVLEYVAGNSLAAHANAAQLLPPARVLDIGFKCCWAFEHAHTRGVMHRDIKPANLMLDAHGELKVADFGLAACVDAPSQTDGPLMGSPSYLSPERVRGEPDGFQSDVFALGVTLYELLTGQRPFDGETAYATLYRIGHEAPVPPTCLRPELPEGLDRVMQRALAKQAAHRYSCWGEFAEALLAINRSLPSRRSDECQGEYFARLRALPFFCNFDDVALWQALRLGQVKTHPRGTALMREDLPGDSFSVILEGRVGISRHGWKLSTVPAGVTLGEMAYLQPKQALRSATAVAETDVVALEIPNQALRQAPQTLQARFDKAFIRLLVERLSATTAQVGSWDLMTVS